MFSPVENDNPETKLCSNEPLTNLSLCQISSGFILSTMFFGGMSSLFVIFLESFMACALPMTACVMMCAGLVAFISALAVLYYASLGIQALTHPISNLNEYTPSRHISV